MISAEDMADLVERLEAEFTTAFLELVGWLYGRNTEAEIARKIELGMMEEVIEDVDRAAARLAKEILDGYIIAAEAAAEDVADQIGILVDFDQTNVRAVQAMQENRLELVRQFTDQQRNAVRQAYVDGITAGINPVDNARAIRQSIGLTDYQVRVVGNYRRALETQDWSDALGRELRDGRSDRSIIAAQRKKTGLPQEQIDSMVERYRANWIGYRAETIGRTEALRSVHQGTEEMWRQAVESGEIDPKDVTRTWHIAGGMTRKGKPRTRDSHRMMAGQERPLFEPFLSGDGNLLRYPGDPNAPARDTIDCRCVVLYRIDPASILGKRLTAMGKRLEFTFHGITPGPCGCRHAA